MNCINFSCQIALPEGAKFCYLCGVDQSQEGQKFCKCCGQSLRPLTPPPTETRREAVTFDINDYKIEEGTLEQYYGDALMVVIPDEVTRIKDHCFSGDNIQGVQFHDKVEHIENNAFSYCFHLNEVNLPQNLLTIGASAFQNCTSLAKIEIPSSVLSIGDNAFSGCEVLRGVELNSEQKEKFSDRFHGTPWHQNQG